jgi:pyruvate formate lyase activating enzyme
MIRGRIDTSMVDWDGKLAMVLFFDRCNFACPFCQNWELMNRPESYPAIDLEDVLQNLSTRKDWIDGVVLTGGEPTLDPDELRSVIARIRALGLLIKLDTNGALPTVLRELIRDHLVDYVAMDVKSSLDERYGLAAGTRVDPNRVSESVRILRSGAVDYEFRTTMVPGIIDEDGVRKIGTSLRGAKKWYLQVFVPENAPPGPYREKKFTAAEIERLLAIAREYVPEAKVRGSVK